MAKKKTIAVEEESLETSELEGFSATNIFTEEEGFLPEIEEETTPEVVTVDPAINESELAAFETAEIEEKEFIEEERLDSILESILFASDRPVSLAALKTVFKGTNVTNERLRAALNRFATELAGGRRGVSLEEVTGGFQLRSKLDNLEFMKRSLKTRAFRLSGPALEVLAIAAYKQPLIKSEIDEIRGVESGHLLRALMEKNLVQFAGRAENRIGKPMQYSTTKRFLEIFGLRNLQELPTLSQIDELLPEGMTEEEGEKLKLSDLTEPLSRNIGQNYSDGEEELQKVAEQLEGIQTSSEFFEKEKLERVRKRHEERAQNIRDAIMLGEEVTTRDRNWLTKWDEALMQGREFEGPAEA